MISPDVAAAVERLERGGALGPEQARLFRRVARGELVSLSSAIHALLYLGVVAVTSGVGLLFRNEIEHLGPLTIAVSILAMAALCLGWVARHSPPFSRGEVVSPHFAFDYVLALGALLAGGDLAFIESQFSPLGDQWAYHLLLISAFYAALAFRFDSRTMFALSLTAFAAWRGVAATSVERAVFGFFDETDAVRLNALLCGLLFVALGRELSRQRLKAHFDPTATPLGWFLILEALAWGINRAPWAGLHRLALLVVGTGLAWFAWRGGRFVLFVFGVLAAYLGLMVAVADAIDNDTGILLLVAVSAILLVFGLAAMHRRFPKDAQE
ncbi:MAG: hypothetical protein ABI565_04005 [Vicinamibacteria bacterium]